MTIYINCLNLYSKFVKPMKSEGNIIIYQTKDGETSIEVKFENETFWINR